MPKFVQLLPFTLGHCWLFLRYILVLCRSLRQNDSQKCTFSVPGCKKLTPTNGMMTSSSFFSTERGSARRANLSYSYYR